MPSPEQSDTHVEVKATKMRELRSAVRHLVAAEYDITAACEFLSFYCARYEDADKLEALERELLDLRARLVLLDAEIAAVPR